MRLSSSILTWTAATALCAALAAPLPASAQTAPASMLGTWTALSGGTIATAAIAGSPGAYTLHAAAPCTPTPCDWGTAPLTIYAPSVGSSAGYIGTATFAQGFVTRIVVVTALNAAARVLRVQVFSRFSGTGRSNYATTQTLH